MALRIQTGHPDWCRNGLKDPAVSVALAERRFDGSAALVTDGDLILKISQIKYSDKGSLELGIVIEITPSGTPVDLH